VLNKVFFFENFIFQDNEYFVEKSSELAKQVAFSTKNF
jgi:hypothetical protein